MRPSSLLVGLLVVVGAPAGCTGAGPSSSAASSSASSASSASSSAGAAGAVTVTGTDSACTPSTVRLAVGEVVLWFANAGSSPSGVRVLGPDGVVEAALTYVQPGSRADLPLHLPAGSYVVECTPGMAGRSVRAEIALGTAPGLDPRLTAATAGYRQWVLVQARASLTGVQALRTAVTRGDLAAARRLYPASRVGWERIEPVAEAFGDLDPKIDARLADLEAGQPWTGWHVIERGLFEGRATVGLADVAAQLERDVGELVARLPTAPLSVASMASGALQLLDEVSRTKVTGEEEIFSRTDLVDFQANVAGARQVVELFRPVLAERDAVLLAEIDRRLGQVQTRLDALRTGPGDTAFVSYATVDETRRRELSDAVDAAAEPISRMPGALTGSR